MSRLHHFEVKFTSSHTIPYINIWSKLQMSMRYKNTTSITHTPYTNIQHPSHPLHKYTTSFYTPKLIKNTTFNNRRYTTNIPTDTTTDIKTRMRHIHKCIVSRLLTTRSNNKILRTPPPHISSSEEILPRLP